MFFFFESVDGPSLGLIEWVNQLIGFPTLAIAVVLAILSVFYCVALFFCGLPHPKRCDGAPSWS